MLFIFLGKGFVSEALVSEQHRMLLSLEMAFVSSDSLPFCESPLTFRVEIVIRFL